MNKKVRQFLKFTGISSDQEISIEQEKVERTYRSISDDETSKLIKAIYNPTNQASSFSINSIPSVLAPIHDKLVGKKIDNEALFKLAPEIEHAASILIPSIFSPNDLKPNALTLSLTETTEDEATVKEVLKYLNGMFGDDLGLSDKLPQWVLDTLFKSGAKAVAVIPESVITNLRDASVSLESLDIMNPRNIMKKVIDDKFINEFVSDESIHELVASVEGVSELIEGNASETDKKKGIDFGKEIAEGLSSTNLKPIITAINTSSKINVSFDIRGLVAVKTAVEKASVESFDDKFVEMIKNDGIQTKPFIAEQFVDISPYIDTEREGNLLPLLLELPMESVIPVIIEGAPENHIGYFVVLNENGVPLSAEYYGDDYQSIANSKYANHADPAIQKMFDAFYSGNSAGSVGFFKRNMQSQTRNSIVEIVYKTYLNKLLADKMKDTAATGTSKSSSANYNISMNNEISRMMFARLLRNKTTSMIFVPRKLMMYMAFWYNKDGTGRSKIDNIKFPLSLKLTLVISRLMALMESAVNRRRLKLTLNNNIPNPLEIVKTIRKELTKSKQQSLSHNPDTIIQTIVDKQLTVIPDKLPGVDSFDITDEPNNVDYPKADDSLLSEINNMYMLSLDVPPSALNRLGEDEFSKSVVTNNIFLSNKIKGYQKIICKCVSDLIKVYCSYSSKVISGVEDILKNSVSEQTNDEMITPEKLRERAKAIIRSLNMTLPSPNISNNKAQAEEVNNYITIIDSILNNLYPEDVVPDSEMAETIKSMKSYIKSTMLSNYITTNSSFTDITFPSIEDISNSEHIKLYMKIANAKKGFDSIKAGVVPPEVTETIPDSAPAEDNSDDFGGGDYS